MFLMIGLQRTDASTASLLLTLEGRGNGADGMVHFSTRTSTSSHLAWRVWSEAPLWPAIVAACTAWGLDNNLICKVSLADPLQIVELKGMIAGR
jgi:hypothetical protein